MLHYIASPIINPATLKTLTKSMLAITLSMAGIAHANLYDSVTFFGDSLTDGGYFSPLVPGGAQFTTNPDDTWATSFAEQLGTTAVANTYGGGQTGNNYAIGGARAGEEVINTALGPPIAIDSAGTQVGKYLSTNKVDPNGLYVVWAGANDLLAAGKDPANALSIIGSAVSNQALTIKALKDNGANYILVPNVPDLGKTPDSIVKGDAVQAQTTVVTNQYNQAMLNAAAATGANIIPLDTFNLLQQISANPSTYGFTNVTDKACINLNGFNSLVCGPNNLITPDADESYFFADGVHPTGRAHQMIADYANAVVTAPSQIGVLPHIATRLGLATNERLQSHVNQLQSSRQPPARALWAIGEIESQDIVGFDSDGNVQVLLGVDFAHSHSANAVSGLYGNITQKEFDNSRAARGLSNIELDEIGFGIYHSNTLEQFGGLQINGAIGFGTMDVDITRAVTLDNYRQEFKSSADGKRYYANLQAGYPMQLGKTDITPYLGATVSRVKLDALQEKEMSGIAMQFDEQKYTTTYGKLGVKANHDLADNLKLFGDLHYQKQLDDNRDAVSARLNTIQNISFYTPMLETDDDSFAMTLGLSRKFGLLNVNAGVSHSQGDDDQATSVFVGLSGAF
jgi:outer membrane lipase/esterase